MGKRKFKRDNEGGDERTVKPGETGKRNLNRKYIVTEVL